VLIGVAVVVLAASFTLRSRRKRRN
jgi:hypothetical protein